MRYQIRKNPVQLTLFGLVLSSFLFACHVLISFNAQAQTLEQVDEITKAIKFDDIKTVKELVPSKINPNTLSRNGDPLVVVAVKENSRKTLDYLVNLKDVDLDRPNMAGENLLMMAAYNNYLTEVQYLVEKKAVNVNKSGWTPLHYACTNGHLKMAEFLIDKGAKVDSLSPYGSTPLMMAVRSGNIDLVLLLLQRGADIRVRNERDYTAIDVADMFNQTEIRDGLMARWKKLYKADYVSMVKPVAENKSP